MPTVVNRAFPVVAAHTWNDLTSDVTSAESLSTFRQRLETHLFLKSFPGYFLDFNWSSWTFANLLQWTQRWYLLRHCYSIQTFVHKCADCSFYYIFIFKFGIWLIDIPNVRGRLCWDLRWWIPASTVLRLGRLSPRTECILTTYMMIHTQTNIQVYTQARIRINLIRRPVVARKADRTAYDVR